MSVNWHKEVLMRTIVVVLSGIALVASLTGCMGSAPDSPYPHTVNNDGIMHGAGIDDPLANCTECHGDQLEGTASTPSCYDCHGQRW